ncbi:MAG: hypothetical protein HY360_15275 [Verrucomicrobia bacterium]|nr:hypothetical protein [Verrucomicrobiota bacterium]
MIIPLKRHAPHDSALGICSVPVLPGLHRLAAANATLQAVPMGFWPAAYLEQERFARVGPFWGVNALPGSPWNGAHLLADLAEFLIRSDPSDPVTPELLDGGKRLLQTMLKMLAEMDYFHRASGSFAWRRHYHLAQLIGDRPIIEGIHQTLRTAIARFEREGDKFFDMGHHCAGYIDNPWFFLGCESRSCAASP